ncbi:methyltransferase type 11 [Geodermatophilus sp. TF02-6]|uniref:class I SAM-dependent methyltransferase n=1 Tax=Geodermatophilus sp. TF02-6 TaxID=2250575 RepID=UPI000DEBD09C|nr:methyltransferase domain-containing protein [Geodermatophilus sp. TF02-6]RBY80615.1 methyltransferase type 11 [Geodermatophilus sp. TF02-6]
MTGGWHADGDEAPRVVDWDAAGYARLSTPQQSWARDVLARLHLRGDETVVDLGCGAGLVTEQLAALVPRGRVVAVDVSAAMVRATRARLGDRAEVVRADLHEFTWPEPADVLVSTATLHWVPDHARLWRHLRGLLRPGGVLAVQYGGAGNIPGVEEAMAELAGREPFAAHLAPFRSPWTFDAVETARREVATAGFTDVRVWSERRPARPPDVPAFLATSVAVTELDRLPEELRDRYTAALFAALGAPEELGYVRLDVDARAG